MAISKSTPKILNTLLGDWATNKAALRYGLSDSVKASRGKGVTIMKTGLLKIKKTSGVSAKNMRQIVDTDILQDAHNVGYMSTALKRLNSGGIIIEADAPTFSVANSVRDLLKTNGIPTTDSALSRISKIDADILRARQVR
jgi:reverse gyrase